MLKRLYKKLKIPAFQFEMLVYFMFFMFVILNIKIIKMFDFHSKIYKKIENNIKKDERLEIIDRNNKYLAINKKVYNLYIDSGKIIKINENIDKIFNIININENKIEKIKQLIYKAKKNQKTPLILLKNNISEKEKDLLIKEGVFGVYFEEYNVRSYPYKNSTSHIVGFTSSDINIKGLSGLEFSFDSYLSNSENEKALQLSIDIEKQEALRNILMENISKHNAIGGSAVIMKINGEILSAVSLPDFNPNEYQKANTQELFNRFSLGVYELGSVCKVFLGAYSNEVGIDIERKYKREEYKIDNFTIHDIDKKEQTGGYMTLFAGIVNSSNVICSKAIEYIGFKDYYTFFYNLNLTEKIDIEIPEIGTPIFTKKETLINAITMSYGHGFAISVLNYLKAIGTILNNGEEIFPTFLKKEEYQIGNKIIEKESSDIVKRIMRAGFTSKRYKIFEKYNVGAKTGTSIKIDKFGRYDRNKINVQLVGAFPMKEPEYIIFIMLEDPKKSGNLIRGSDLVPILKEILEDIF